MRLIPFTSVRFDKHLILTAVFYPHNGQAQIAQNSQYHY